MNTSDSGKWTRTIHLHIVDVVQQKEGGYRLIIQPQAEDFEISSDEIWRTAFPGDYRRKLRFFFRATQAQARSSGSICSDSMTSRLSVRRYPKSSPASIPR